MADPDAVSGKWFASLRGARAGRAVGYRRFKKKGKALDSFLHPRRCPPHHPSSYRRLRVARIGQLRLHGTAKRVAQLRMVVILALVTVRVQQLKREG